MISQETINEVREKASLVEIAGETMALKRAGSQYMGLCPFHAEKTPSFHIKDDNFFHCFGCGASGNVISFVMRSRGLSFQEAVEDLAQRLGIALKLEGGRRSHKPREETNSLWQANTIACEYFSLSLRKADRRVLDYLVTRALSKESVETFRVGFAPDARTGLRDYLSGKGVAEADMLRAGLVKRSAHGDIYDAFRARLMFPIFLDQKRIGGFGGRIIPTLLADPQSRTIPKYLNTSETPIYEKSKVLYGVPQTFEAIRKLSEVYIVEGYMDLVSLWQAGVRNVLAVCGTALGGKHVQRLKHLANRVYLLFDGDVAGRAASARSFQLFLNSGLDVAAVFLPPKDDPDSFAKHHGASTAQALAELGTVPLIDSYLDSILQKYNAKDGSALGAALKGRAAAEVAQALRAVTNTIEQGDLIERVAMRLLVEPQEFELLVAGKEPAPVAAARGEEGEPERAADQAVPKFELLPALDREVLTLVMAQRERYVTAVLNDPELCETLQPVSVAFIEALRNLIAEQTALAPDYRKDAVKTLLREFGESWKRQWVKAYELAEDGGTDLARSFSQCLQAVRKTKLTQVISEIERAIRESASEKEKLDLYQQRLMLTRQLDLLDNKSRAGAG